MPRTALNVRLGHTVHVVNEPDACLAGTVANWDRERGSVSAAALHVTETDFAEWLPHRGPSYDPAGSDGGTFHLPEECPWLR